MDQPLIERRAFNRFGPPAISHVQAVLRPGRPVCLVNLSAGGALIEGRRPLRPGGRVHLQLSTDERSAGRAGHVLRCAVASLTGADGVRYRGAMRFDDEWPALWEEMTRSVYRLPMEQQSQETDPGQKIPAGEWNREIVEVSNDRDG